MRRRPIQIIVALATSALVLATQGFGILGTNSDTSVGSVPAAPADAAAQISRASGASLQQVVDRLESRVADTPGDYVAHATLALAYVQLARVTINPSYYPKAEQAVADSLAINDSDNYLAYAGGAALAAGRHRFPLAQELATKGLAINPYSALLYGILSDAQVQRGYYQAGSDSVQKMLDLRPDTASLSRASYAFEIRGDLRRAGELMQRALDDAPTGADRAFALYHLGQLAFEAGDPKAAFEYQLAALAASPDDAAAQFGRAVAEAALGQTESALGHFAELVERVPDPAYFVAYGRLLESLGRISEAETQYSAIAAAAKAFASNGELPDTDAVFLQIQTGLVDEAIAAAEVVMETRPFIRTHDAYAWALHAAGRDEEALLESEAALVLGTRFAVFYYHSGMIKLALGDTAGARADLEEAMAINPFFDPLDAVIARQTLQTLNGGE